MHRANSATNSSFMLVTWLLCVRNRMKQDYLKNTEIYLPPPFPFPFSRQLLSLKSGRMWLSTYFCFSPIDCVFWGLLYPPSNYSSYRACIWVTVSKLLQPYCIYFRYFDDTVNKALIGWSDMKNDNNNLFTRFLYCTCLVFLQLNVDFSELLVCSSLSHITLSYWS